MIGLNEELKRREVINFFGEEGEALLVLVSTPERVWYIKVWK